MPIHAYAAHKAGGPLEPFDYRLGPLGPHQVAIDVTHCGLCHTDLHILGNAWGNIKYPLVPGHEVVGRVVARGPEVTELAVGQRVGVGFQKGSCGECDLCETEQENLCLKTVRTCVGHHGGFSSRIYADAHFAIPIPKALGSAEAAPLLCAGVTVYAPMSRADIGPGTSVGVLGIGGLGHLAIRFAVALGADVTAFSRTRDKEAEARAFGADHFVATEEPGALKAAQDSVDLFISTVHADLDWEAYLRCVRANGTLCFVGVPREKLRIHAGLLLARQRSITASLIGSPSMTAEMLQVAAERKVAPQIEVLPMREVNEAVRRLRLGDVRYRFVLEAERATEEKSKSQRPAAK